jgi:hypothetical protein
MKLIKFICKYCSLVWEESDESGSAFRFVCPRCRTLSDREEAVNGTE